MDGVTVTTIDLDADERFTSLSQPLGLESMGCRLVTLEPRQRARIHRHREQEELYVVLAGELTVVIEQTDEVTLGRHQAARIAPSVRRQLVNKGARRVSVLALGAAGTHEPRDGEAFGDWSETEGRSPLDVPFPDDLPA